MFPYRFMKWICLNSALRNLNQFLQKIYWWYFCFVWIIWISLKISCISSYMSSQFVWFIWTKKNAKLSFLDVEVSRKQSKFATAVYRKPNFSSVYGHFEGFFTNGIQSWYDIHANCRCFNIYSDWIKFHEELSFLKNV